MWSAPSTRRHGKSASSASGGRSSGANTPTQATPRETWTHDQRRAYIIHHPGRSPAALVEAWPAHIHLNLLPRAQRRGVGSSLLEAWLDRAAARGVTAVHVGVNQANTGGLRFWDARGFRTLTLDGLAPGRTVWMGRGGLL